MPWENKTGGRGPWGQGPSGGNRGGGQPPDLEEFFRRSQDRLKQVMPQGPIGPIGAAFGAVAVAAIWLASGFYTVGPGEVGVETRFGRFSEETRPGLNYRFPWPFEAVQVVNTSAINDMVIGIGAVPNDLRPAQARRASDPATLMLTRDENIVDISFLVTWRRSNARDFVFNVAEPENSIRAVAESAMREVIGRTNLVAILGDGSQQGDGSARERLQTEVQGLVQAALDEYGAGVEIQGIRFQIVNPPVEVLDAFRAVQAAKQDGERLQNEALGYSNRVIPEARGEAAKIEQQAEGYRIQAIADARGEIQRLVQLYDEYRRAPQITRERIFIETMEKVMTGMNKVILDEGGGAWGVVPYLPLPDLRRPQAQNTPPAILPQTPPGGN